MSKTNRHWYACGRYAKHCNGFLCYCTVVLSVLLCLCCVVRSCCSASNRSPPPNDRQMRTHASKLKAFLSVYPPTILTHLLTSASAASGVSNRPICLPPTLPSNDEVAMQVVTLRRWPLLPPAIPPCPFGALVDPRRSTAIKLKPCSRLLLAIHALQTPNRAVTTITQNIRDTVEVTGRCRVRPMWLKREI